eukprot:5657445-Pyramimonas_sp.AAC.1
MSQGSSRGHRSISAVPGDASPSYSANCFARNGNGKSGGEGARSARSLGLQPCCSIEGVQSLHDVVG